MVEQAHYAHYFVFGALILAGFNLPISEDIIAILTGALASRVVPENAFKLYLALIAGAFLSDWIAYTIGRLLGSRIWKWRWVARIFKRERVDRITDYYERYGFITLVVGRFIPFGVRNCLFFTSGMVRLPFARFALADGIGCFGSITLTFCIGYFFTKNFETVRSHIQFTDVMIFASCVLAIFLLVWYKRRKKVVTE